MTWIGADSVVPGPSNDVRPKWAIYGLAISGAWAIDNFVLNENSAGDNCPVPGTTPERVTKGNTDIRNKPGDSTTANGDFDDLGLRGVSDEGGGVRVGTAGDGATVIVRPSADGRPTIEIQSGGRTRIRIRYGK